ncbi:hypothetical protein HOO65_100045 [Ceratocystis lukuohia]|uniref:Transposase n=1 Tax=Ceratocystis lukuohia TaxID=2019550 RepID=A0ABR4M8P5_9PEZI
MANRLLADRDASPVSKRWASNFIKSQPDLKTCFNRRYDYERAKYEDPVLIRDWFRLVESTVAKYGINIADIYNFDETGFTWALLQVEWSSQAWKDMERQNQFSQGTENGLPSSSRSMLKGSEWFLDRN